MLWGDQMDLRAAAQATPGALGERGRDADGPVRCAAVFLRRAIFISG